MHSCKGLPAQDFDDMEDVYHIQFEDELFGQYWFELYATQILYARYQWTDMKDVIVKHEHLNDKQTTDLLFIKTRSLLVDSSVCTPQKGSYEH